MRYIILILLTFLSLQARAYSITQAFAGSHSCSEECDPYDPKNCNNFCTQDECSATEVAYQGRCYQVDCSLTPENPVQIGNTCNAKPKCFAERDEYTTSSGDCMHCPSPGVFDNDTCNYCPDGQRYSEQHGQCMEIQCAPDYEYKDGMCRLKDCPSGEIRDPRYGYCTKIPDPPTCPSDQVLSFGKCVPIDTPIETDCAKIDGAVECMTDSIVGAADTLKNDLNSKLLDIVDLFTSISDGLDKVKDTNSNTGNETEPDTSQLAADTPFRSIQKSELSESLFRTREQCPPDRIFTAWKSSYHFSYQKICDVLQKLSFIVMLIAFVTSVKIIVRD